MSDDLAARAIQAAEARIAELEAEQDLERRDLREFVTEALREAHARIAELEAENRTLRGLPARPEE